MTTDLATRTGALDLPTQASLVSDTVARWAQDIGACAQLAAQIVQTELVPASYWPTPPGIKAKDMPGGNPRRQWHQETDDAYRDRLRVATQTAAGTIYTSAHLGIPWNTGLRGIFYVSGTQGMKAELMLSLYLAAGHEQQLELEPDERPAAQRHLDGERSAVRAAAWFRRKGRRQWQLFDFTFDQAVTAGFVPDRGPAVGKAWMGNDKYLRQPETMLWWRMVSAGIRATAPEVLGGLACVEDLLDEPAAVVGPADAAVHVEVAGDGEQLAREVSDVLRTAQATGQLRSEAPVRVVDPDPVPSPEQVAAGPISRATRTAIGARFDELGLGGRSTASVERRARIVAHVAARAVAGLTDLTEGEGRLILGNVTAATLEEVERQAAAVPPGPAEQLQHDGDVSLQPGGEGEPASGLPSPPYDPADEPAGWETKR